MKFIINFMCDYKFYTIAQEKGKSPMKRGTSPMTVTTSMNIILKQLANDKQHCLQALSNPQLTYYVIIIMTLYIICCCTIGQAIICACTHTAIAISTPMFPPNNANCIPKLIILHTKLMYTQVL